jgi:hypothetical protein
LSFCANGILHIRMLYSAYNAARRPWIVLLILASLPLRSGFGDTGSTTQTLNAALSPIAKLTSPGSVALTRGSTAFTTYQGTVPLTFRVRTTPTGAGSITMQVTSDFSPAGGPSAAANGLTYACAASFGTPCSANQTASTSVQTPVLTLPASACTGGGGACSGSDPNTVTVTFSLTDDPQYATGSYSAQVTFTISAT